MDLRRLECFVAVAERLSFRRAAEHLHLSPSPLTRQISALEREVGVRLLERGRRRTVALTAAGQAFLTPARQALESMAAATQRARAAAGGKDKQLVIAGCAGLAAPLLAAHFQTFRRRWPEVEVSFIQATHAEELSALEQGRAHLVISADFAPPRKAVFCSRELADVELVAVLPANHPSARQRGTGLFLQALNGETLLCPTAASTPSYHEFLQDLRQRTGFAPQAVRSVDGLENLLAMVAAGYGIAITHARTVEQPPPDCRIKRLRLPPLGYRRRMIWLKDSPAEPLRDFLRVANAPPTKPHDD